MIFNNCLDPQNWPISLDWLPPETHLVGGAVRDGLLQRQREYLDLDFILPVGAVATARKIAQHYQAGFVVLDEKRQIARVVFPQATLDFAQQEGDSLVEDLQRRDFTINAIAFNPHSQQLIDSLGGLTDLKQGCLRMISRDNLEDDPLRLLRAYRQGSQLNFTIEPNTRAAIRSLAPLLIKCAAERVQTELDYLLTNPQGNSWLALAYQDGLLSVWLPQVTPEKLALLDKIDEKNDYINLNNQQKKIAKLACLVESELELIELKYPRNISKDVEKIITYLPQLMQITKTISLREQYFLFKEVGNVFPMLALLTLAKGGNKEAIAKGGAPRAIASLINRYDNPKDPVAHPQPLITGNDLIKNLKILPSPKIGYLLTEIQIAQIEGKISTKPQALDLAKELYRE